MSQRSRRRGKKRRGRDGLKKRLRMTQKGPWDVLILGQGKGNKGRSRERKKKRH